MTDPLKIYRYGLVPGEQRLHMPRGARLLSVGLSTDGYGGPLEMSLWAIVNPNTDDAATTWVDRRIVVCGAGALSTPEIARMPFVGTIVQPDEAHHVFDGGEICPVSVALPTLCSA